MFTGLSYEVISVTHAISVKYPIRKDRKTKQNSDCLCSVPESTPPVHVVHFPFLFCVMFVPIMFIEMKCYVFESNIKNRTNNFYIF